MKHKLLVLLLGLFIGGMIRVVYNEKAKGEWFFADGGQVEVRKEQDGYSISFEGTLSNGAKVSGKYMGKLEKREN